VVRVRCRTRVTFRGGLIWAMGLVLTAFMGGLALKVSVSAPVLDFLLSLLAYWLPAAVCWCAFARAAFRRREVLLGATAVTANAAGNTYVFGMTAADVSLHFPSLADVGFMLFYPLMLAALIQAVRHHSRGMASWAWLDCAVGSLGAASVLAVLLTPVLTSAPWASHFVASVFAVTYAMLDLLLVAAVTGIAALRGVRGGDRWGLLVSGLMIFAAADVIWALQVEADTLQIGTPLDAGWPIGLALIALYVDGAARGDRPAPQEKTSTTGSTALIVAVASTAAGLGVLLVSSQTPVSTLAVILAGVALIAATARTQVLFRDMARMADLRRQDAITDELTGLPNRRAFYAEAHARLAGPQRRQHRRQALLMLDLNRFKEVNDSLGHQTGDQLLIQVGARLGAHLRTRDLLVRLGGDEFAILLEGAGREQAAAAAAKLCAALTEPFDLEDLAVHSGVSIGIALFPDDGTDLSTLLRKADVAMFKAKVSGDGHHVYGGADDADFATRLRTVEELRTAVSSDQFLTHYQPKVNLRTGEVHSVEALVRWDHPTRGLLYPEGFLAVVEHAGLMRDLTRVVLAKALDQSVVWRAGGRRLTVAVNLSASSMTDTDLPERVAAMLAARNLPPGALQLEITEEFLMVDHDRALDILTRLRGQGIEISVDDFGTGFSSLSYLRDLPIDELKLDRSFVLPLIDHPRAAALVASTISLAHSLDLRMVAEGVEDEVTYAELGRLGCDQAQGNYISRPLPAAELEHWLNTWHTTDKANDLPQLIPSAALN
jgi:diguanylate cyclase